MKFIHSLLCLFIYMSCYAQNDDTKNLIFHYNHDILQEKINSELKKIKIEHNILEEKEIGRNQQALTVNLSKYKIILNDIIQKNESNIIVSEAYFRLSLISMEENPKKLLDAIHFLETGLKNIDAKGESFDLYIKMNYLAGNLYLLVENYSKAENSYQNVIMATDTNSDNKLYTEEKIRSVIGKGDCAYLQLDFSSAFKIYQMAQNILNKTLSSPGLTGGARDISLDSRFRGNDNRDFESSLNQAVQQNLDVLISFRMILSAYRDGDYKLAMNQIKAYAYQRQKFKKYIDDNILKHLIHISGAALYELKSKALFEEIAENKIYGDFGKKIILESFPLFLEAGESKFIDGVAREIKNNFSNSIDYYLFLKNWIEVNKNNENKERFFQVCYFGSVEIAKNSLWHEKFILDKNQDDLRRNIVLKYSLPSAEFYYEQGLQNKSKTSFLMSAEIYKARLDENWEKDNRGILFQKYADALFMAEQFQSALKAIEQGLEFHLENSFLKSGLALRVQIARALSSDSKKTIDENYRQYENAVDSFVTQFPKEPQARDGLFESAKRAENMGDFDNAKVRYERLLSYTPQSNNEFSLEEKNKTLQALAALLLKIKNSNVENVNIASEFEDYLVQFDVNDHTKSSMQTTNAKLAQSYYSKLNMDGKVLESAHFLSRWAENNNKNPNSPAFYIDSIKTFAQLQEWKKVLVLAQNFSTLYPNNERVFSAYFWQGKAYENLLLFSLASDYYVKSANPYELFPSIQEKIVAIDKSILIYKEFFKQKETAHSMEIKAELLSKNKENINNIALAKMQAAEIYFNLGEYKTSEKIYFSVSQTKKIKKDLQDESKLNYLVAKLHTDKSVLSKIDHLFSKNRDKEFIEKPLTYINNYDKNTFTELDHNFHSQIDLELLEKMSTVVRRIEQRKKYLSQNSSLSSPGLTGGSSDISLDSRFRGNDNGYFESSPSNMDALLGELYEALSNNYSFAYYHGSKKEQHLKIAENYQIEAKKFYATALSKLKTDDPKKMKIYFQARNYFSVPENVRPQFLFQEKIESKFLLKNLSVNNQLNERQEKLKQALNDIDAGDELHGLPILDRLIFEEDKWEEIYLALSQFYLNKKSYILARSVALKALDKLSEPPVDIYIDYAASEIALNHIDNATKILEKAQTLYRKNAKTLGWLAIVDLKHKHILEACKKFDEAYNYDSTNVSVLYNHAACLIQSQEYELASTVLQQGLAHLNTNPDLYYLGGVLENRRNKPVDSRKYLENFLKYSSSNDSRRFYITY